VYSTVGLGEMLLAALTTFLVTLLISKKNGREAARRLARILIVRRSAISLTDMLNVELAQDGRKTHTQVGHFQSRDNTSTMLLVTFYSCAELDIIGCHRSQS
jgi:hypothetical protein